MGACSRAALAWCVLLALATAAAYTVDCNHEYADCDTELSKIVSEDDESIMPKQTATKSLKLSITSTASPTRSTPILENKTESKSMPETETETETITVVTENPEPEREPTFEIVKPKSRFLNLNVDELQNFANALHNQSTKGKKLGDLSDVNLDDDEEEPSRIINDPRQNVHKGIPDKFYSNLQAPFHPMSTEKERGSEEMVETCKENGIVYKVGERIDRGCEEACECSIRGVFECSPRCKHPYIRRGRRLNDPLCFESPVDECCSIIACATGNGEPKPSKLEVCQYKNESYSVGTKWHIGCEQTCTCKEHSLVTCEPRCKPLITSEKCINVQDPNDACCEVQVCDVSQDVHEQSENATITSSNNTTPYDTSTSIDTGSSTDASSSTASATDMSTATASMTSASSAEIEASSTASITIPTVTLSSSSSTHEFTLAVEDPTDTTVKPLESREPIGSVKVLQNNTVQVNLINMNHSQDPIQLLLSSDGGRTFHDVELKYTNLILNLEGGKDYILKTRETGTKFNFTITTTDNKPDDPTYDEMDEKIGCWQDGKFYGIGEEFHVGCTELCECIGDNARECAALVCPNHVGLELMSKGCVRWAPSPPATPPNCCPRSARCLSDGTCHYNGIPVPNWSEVPLSLTGCEQRCFCENGELDCQEVCSPLPPVPPQNLRCPPLHKPAAVNISDDDCCKQWSCVPNGHSQPPNILQHTPPAFLPTIPPEIYAEEGDYTSNNVHRQVENPLPPNIQVPNSFGDMNKKLSVITVESDSPSSIKMLLGLPPVLVGLRGSVDLRYTDKADEDVAHWYSQVFAPADEILTTPRLEFRLTGLKSSTIYKIRGKLYLHNLPVSPESDVYSVRTQDIPVVEEKRREVNSRLSIIDVNDTSASVNWRHFSEDELLLIDGIQVRYRPVGTPIYSMTELLHHSRSTALLSELRPDTRYEASLVLIPPPRATTELYDPANILFLTKPHYDPYNWTVTLEAVEIGSDSAHITWHGIPSPAERWVRVYRAAHACGDHPGVEHDEFRLAARDQPPSITLNALTPSSRCRIWLELFLTNGKVKTSNVLEINTKSLATDHNVDNEIEASSISGGSVGTAGPRGDYYTALVGVGVVAALGALTSLLLLLVVVRRHRPRSVPITPVPSAPRESSLPPYDNPAYKLELQQETMDL